MLKAITPVIAIILLLLIGMALAGSAYTFIFGVAESSTAKTIRVVYGSENENTVVVQNLGTDTIQPGDIRIVVSGQGANTINPTSIPSKQGALIEFGSPVSGENLNVRIIGPSNTVSYKIDIIPIKWNKTFGGGQDDQAHLIHRTLDRGYIITGYTESFGPANRNAWLIKTDSNGNEQWNKPLGSSDDDNAYSVQQTSDNGYIVAGFTNSSGAGNSDAWIIKTDSDGNEQWNKTFGGSNKDNAYSVQQTSDNGYIIAGITYSSGAGNSDAWIIKTDSNGNEQWNKTFGGLQNDFARSLSQTSENGYIISGYTYSSGAGGSDVWIIKTDSNGNEQWNKTFGGLQNDIAYSVQQTSDGGYIITGYTYSFSGTSDVWLIKTDSNGNEQWNKTFGGDQNDLARSVLQTLDRGYIIAGRTFFPGTDYDAWLIKTDSNGNEQWNKTFGGGQNDQAYTTLQTPDSGYIIAGFTFSYGAGSGDFWIIKTDSYGNTE